jgi:hypothetical protein
MSPSRIPESKPAAELTIRSVSALVSQWYFLLDVHAAQEELRALLSSDHLEMRFPEATLTTLDQFAKWYDGVTHVFFDEVHDLQTVDIRLAGDNLTADITIVVRWLARRWKAPASKSEWLGFNAAQRWKVTLSSSSRPVITQYIVDSLSPIAGSAAL